MRPGRQALLLILAAYVLALGWAALALPARVPSHFDGAGRVDAWSSRTSMLALWAVIGLAVLVGVPALTRLATSGDGTWINMPQASKDYWLSPERRVDFRLRFQDDMEGFTAPTGVLLVALLGIMTWVGATGRDGAPWWTFVALVGGYLLLSLAWVVRLLRTYRPPTSP